MLTIDHQGRLYAGFDRPGLLSRGVPEQAIAAAEAVARREDVKAECRRRIYSVGSAEAQINVTAMTAAIGAKAASSRSAEDRAFIETAQTSIDWVMAMRTRFAELADAASDLDYLADASWPACPADVIALYQQF